MHHKTKGNSLPLTRIYWQTWCIILLTLWFSSSTREISSGCRGMDRRGLHPSSYRNCWISSAVTHVPWSDVITELAPTKEKTNALYKFTITTSNHIQLSLLRRATEMQKENECKNRLGISNNYIQPYQKRGPTTSICRCENGIASRGTMDSGRRSFTSNLAFCWHCK